MANILPVSGMLNPLPDFNQTWRQGVQFGQQQRQQSEAREREQQVRNLAPQIVAGDPAAYSQAAAIDPQAAETFQGAGDGQLRRFKGFVSYIDQAREQAKQTGDWRHVDAALQQANPWLTQILGKPGPTAWPQGDPQWEAGWEGLKARIAGADASDTGSRVQSRFVADDGTVWALMADGQRQQLTDAQGAPIKADRQMWLRDHPGMAPHLVGKDASIVPVGGQAPMGAAPGSAQAPIPQGGGQGFVDDSLALANQMIAAGIPAEQVDAFLQARMNPAQGQPPAAPQGVQFARTGGGLARPSEAQVAAERRAAETAVDLAALPQRQAIETQGAIERARGTEQAKADVERQKGRNKARLSLDQATARIGRVDSLVESIMPRIGAMTAGWGGNMLANVPGTAASDLRKDIGTLQAIAGFDELNAMRASSPTGGALGNVTERELAFLQSVVRNIETSQSPEQLRRNLQDFQREVRGSWQRVTDAYELDYGGQDAPAPSDGPAQPSSDIDSLLDLYR